MKNKNLIHFLIILTVLVSFSTSCKKDTNDNPDNTVVDINDLNISPAFKYNTDDEVSFEITAKGNTDQAIAGVRFDVYTDFKENGGKVIFSGITDADGKFVISHMIPTSLSQVIISTDYIGLPNELAFSVTDNKVIGIFGGKPSGLKSGLNEQNFKSTNVSWYPMGTWNNSGVPNYLLLPRDVIEPVFLNDVNASFPERQPVPTFHPEYLNPQNEQDFKLNEACDVWITFVHEGAGYRNVLLYYTYDINNPPTNPNAIDSLHIVFPNVSYYNSGGGLYSGDRVYLGQFPGGKAIGFAVIANGYNGTTVTGGNGIYYSDPNLNPETDPTKRQHSVVLLDNGRDIFLMGFEDLNRVTGNSDNDFNDVMFIVKANPIVSVQTGGFAIITNTLPDGDGDGVANQFDDYPNDPSKAFNNYYPAQGSYGTLAFEDLWPGKGDYDFNDVVVDYNFNQITNAQNKVVEIKSKIVVKAIGAAYKNGFGFELGVSPSVISNVTGQVITENIVNRNSNNTEAGQTKAVVIITDNVYNVLPYPGGGETGVNTVIGAPYVTPDTTDIIITFSQPADLSTLGSPPYNPFIFVNQDRTKEVHLADKTPTDLHNTSLFGTSQDDSNPEIGRYYKTNNNLPWAINIVQNFDYPIEKNQITSGYLKFGTWAESSGQQFPNWPLNQPGYRSEEHIYSR